MHAQLPAASAQAYIPTPTVPSQGSECSPPPLPPPGRKDSCTLKEGCSPAGSNQSLYSGWPSSCCSFWHAQRSLPYLFAAPPGQKPQDCSSMQAPGTPTDPPSIQEGHWEVSAISSPNCQTEAGNSSASARAAGWSSHVQNRSLHSPAPA